MQRFELSDEQRSGYRRIYTSLGIGIITLATEVGLIYADVKGVSVRYFVHGMLTSAGAGLTGSSVIFLHDANQSNAQQALNQEA
jgi:hypothetical protein